MSLEEALVKAYAKRKGISEEEARAYIEAVKETGGDEALNRLATFFEVLGSSAGDISKLDTDMKSWVAPVMGVYAMKTLAAGDRRKVDIEELAERLTVIKSILGGGELEKLYEAHISDLKSKVEELANRLEAKEREALMQTFQEQLNKVTEAYGQQIDYLNKQLENLSKLVEEYRKSPPTTAEEKESFISRVTSLQKEIEEFTRALEALGMKVVKPGEEEKLNVEEMKRQLEKLGFEVRGPPTWREVEERLKKMREELRKEVEEEMHITERKLKILGAIGLSITNALLSAVGRPELQSGMEVIRRALGAAATAGTEAPASPE